MKSISSGKLSGFLVLSTKTDFMISSQRGWLQSSQPFGQSSPQGHARNNNFSKFNADYCK